jgi:DNA-directed RNA polymerase specialized sigma24 family protein
MVEALAQPKLMEGPCTSHPSGHLHRYKSSRAMSSLSKGNVQLKQIHVEDWEDEDPEDEATEEEELARVQQEIERLHKE